MYVDNPGSVTEFDLRRLEREAEQLARVDAVTANTVKAAIAACRWDTQAVLRWSGAALQLERSYFTLSNAAVSKRLVGDLRAWADLSVEAYEQARTDVKAAVEACEALIFNARFTEALEISARFPNLAEFAEVTKHARQLLNELESIGLNQVEVARQVEIGAMVCAEQHVRLETIKFFLVSDFEDGDRFVAAFVFQGEVSREIALDEALVEKFLDDLLWDPLKFSIEFHYMTTDELLSERSA